MSEVERPLSVSELDQAIDSLDSEPAAVAPRVHTPQGDHEGVESAEAPVDADFMPEIVRGDENLNITSANTTSPAIPSSDPVQPASTLEAEEKPQPLPSKTLASKTKPAMTVKPPAGKTNGGPPTPLVKRIISSGTFGVGSLKPTPAKGSSTVAPVKPSAPVSATTLKKSTSGSSATSKPTELTSRASATTPAAPSKRLSMAPAKPAPPPSDKPSLSASANTKPPVTSRASVVSPAGSVGSSASRPRASVSDGVKKAPLTSRQSISSAPRVPATGATKPPPARSATSTATKPNRLATTSISSIKEVREDGKLLDELQTKLKDSTDSLASKTEAVVALEDQVGHLNSSLEAALADVESKHLLARELEKEKLLLEAQLNEAKEVFKKLESDHQDITTTLQMTQRDLQSAKSDASVHDESIKGLRTQIQTLEGELAVAKENFATLQVSTTTETSAAALADHEALQAAQLRVRTLEKDVELLGVEHAKALQEVESHLKALQEKTAFAEELSAQVARLKEEKEENSGKLSELEIEILELKESQEVVEDERERSLASVKSLEEQLLKATLAAEQANNDFRVREADHTAQLKHAEDAHHEALQSALEEQDKLKTTIETLRQELADLELAQGEAAASAREADEQHRIKLEQAEQGYIEKQTELMHEIERITTELKSQESYYNLKVDAVKEEHKTLLQEAFEKAKDEAREQHAQELQALRSTSSSTIDQIQAMNQSALEALKADHASAMDSEIKGLEKQISNIRLDLKATQDDLAKAKAALEAARAEVASLTAQRDQARAAAASSPETSSEHAAELIRLTQELSVKTDDLEAMTGLLDLTKASLTEMSNNQARELEEAAKSRAEEVTKLRTTHDAAVASLTAEKAVLANELSDIHGELATLKASLGSEASVPKNNGNGSVHPPSPGVTKEELQRMHEAHNLKIHDLQAEHEKAMKALRADLETSKSQTSELQQEVARKTMEIQYLEQDQEENQEQITRLKEDVDSLTESISKMKTAV